MDRKDNIQSAGKADDKSAKEGAGYKRPPSSGQFPKGKSGNPGGRPKGSRNLSATLRELTDTPVPTKVNGKVKRLTPIQIMVHQLLQRALAGDDKAIARLFLLLKEHGIHAPEEPEGKHGVLVVNRAPITYEEFQVLYCNGGVPTEEQIERYRQFMNARCDTLVDQARDRAVAEEDLRQEYGDKFKGFKGDRDPDAMIRAAGYDPKD